MPARKEAAKVRKSKEAQQTKQAVAQLSQSLAKPGISYAQAMKQSLSRVDPAPPPPTKSLPNQPAAFRELVGALTSASTNEQRQFAAIKLILNLWS